MIVIEGIIGAGKTTLAERLVKTGTDCYLYKEPVQENPYLEKFYEDPARYALEMQYYLMAERYRMHLDGIEREWRNGSTTVFDRSIYGDTAFAAANYRLGTIDKRGYECYVRMFDAMSRSLLVPHCMIYLDVSVKTAQERIAERGRECEKGIPDKYLQTLHECYMQYVVGPMKQFTNVRIYKENETIDLGLVTMNHIGLRR